MKQSMRGTLGEDGRVVVVEMGVRVVERAMVTVMVQRAQHLLLRRVDPVHMGVRRGVLLMLIRRLVSHQNRVGGTSGALEGRSRVFQKK
jgi:hypothetical protein